MGAYRDRLVRPFTQLRTVFDYRFAFCRPPPGAAPGPAAGASGTESCGWLRAAARPAASRRAGPRAHGATTRAAAARRPPPCGVGTAGARCARVARACRSGRRAERLRAGERGQNARARTAFPALSSPDNSEAGLRLRISFLFWLTIAQDDGNPPPFECLGGSSSRIASSHTCHVGGAIARPDLDKIDQLSRCSS